MGIPEGFEGSGGVGGRDMSVHVMGANVSQEQQAAWAAANGGRPPQDKRVAFLAEVRGEKERERERGGESVCVHVCVCKRESV